MQSLGSWLMSGVSRGRSLDLSSAHMDECQGQGSA